ncbi:MAG: UDP-N-acetylmuramate--L-alanine ligase [Oligoflexia bacterium]|nr:UDP-N-acetylmuramate--L-alanine ligase [Oligoflexia bacterium]
MERFVNMFSAMNLSKKDIKVHFVGIGGIGMSGIAEILLHLGCCVSGSDISENQNTAKLRDLRAEISIGHRAENIQGATGLVYSSAVDLQNNPEIISGHKKKIPLIRRAEMLALLMRLKYGIAVAGSHGKTTTTSFLATILFEAKMDATHVIGGIVENLGGHARMGDGDLLVAEADESDGSFLLLSPMISIITNIDDDHLDYYKSKTKLVNAFVNFANKVPFYGCCILNIHDEDSIRVSSRINRPLITFGIECEGDDVSKNFSVNYLARNVRYLPDGALYDLYHDGKCIFATRIMIPGRHNVLNSLGAIAAAHQLGIEFEVILEAVKKFKGVSRRLELLYKRKFPERQTEIVIIDDYAHHPTEIANAVETTRKISTALTNQRSKIVVVFEPHRYTRTMLCWDKFLHCFNYADEVCILPIYAASEKPIMGIDSVKLVEDINIVHPQMAKYFDYFSKIEELVFNSLAGPSTLTDHDKVVFLFLGAGSIGKNVRELVKSISEKFKT